jgi:hypothetical protein
VRTLLPRKHCACGGGCQRCQASTPVRDWVGGIQAKLKVGANNDPQEHEADTVARQVLRMPAPEAVLTSAPLQVPGHDRAAFRWVERTQGNKPGAVETATADLFDSVHQLLGSPGQRLDDGAKGYFEARFRYDFSQVRVHNDKKAAASAEALSARAYTAGNHVVFGTGQYAPETSEGRRLLAHELTHVVQQGLGNASPPQSLPYAASVGEADAIAGSTSKDETINAGGVRSRVTMPAGGGRATAPPTMTIMRQPATSVAPVPAIRTFRQVWDEFDEHRRWGRNGEALALVDEILAIMSVEETMAHAGDLALWLLDQGQGAQAMRALSSLESAWWVRWVSSGAPSFTLGGLRATGPAELIQRGEAEAAGRRHDTARELFATASLFLQMQYQTVTSARLGSLQAMERLPPDVDFPLFRLMAHHEVGDLVGQMRRILAFYPALERSAIAAGNQAEAATFADQGRRLQDRIREQFLLTGQPGLTMEASQVTSRRMGTGYRLYGVNQAEVDVFPLPGTPRPDELGRHLAYTAPMEAIFETLRGQEEFLTDLLRNSEMRTEFGSRRIDMTDLATRLRVWRVMYRVFQRAPMAGCPDPLCSVLRLMQRYLRDFTTHTEYNIPDFGTYYVTTEERGGFPTDLLGRTMRDCGVYALTVSYELFRTARGATPRMNVGFQLYHTLEHAMLAILDHDNGKHYVVNNDRISGPNDGVNPLGSVALSYSETMGRTLVVTPVARTDLGTTVQTEAQFRVRAWQRYQAGAGLGLRTEPPSGPTDTRTEAERREATYTGFYRGQLQFEQVGVQLHADLDALLRETAAATATQRGGIVSARLASLTTAGLTMGRIFAMSLDPDRLGVSNSAASSMTTPVGLFTTGRANVAHPLVRLAKVLLFHQGLGGTLTADQQTLVNLVQSGVVPRWTAELSNYIATGRSVAW